MGSNYWIDRGRDFDNRLIGPSGRAKHDLLWQLLWDVAERAKRNEPKSPALRLALHALRTAVEKENIKWDHTHPSYDEMGQ